MNVVGQPRVEVREGGSRGWIVAAVALAAALAMLVIFARQGFVANAGDPYGYGQVARGLLENGFDKVTRRSAMLYPHVLWVLYGLGLGNGFVQAMHCALHVLTTLLVYRLGLRIFNERTAFVGALLTALHPMLLRYVADLHTETMLVFMSVLMVWRAAQFYDRPTVANGIVLGLVGMLATLTKGVMLPFLLAFGGISAVVAIFRSGFTVRALAPVFAIFVAMTVVVAPWTYRNYQVSGGKFVPLTPGTPDAFLRGYIFTRWEFMTLQRPPYIDAENESNALFRRIAEENGTTWELDEVVDDQNNAKEMKRMIREHPFLTVRKVVVGLLTFWYEMTSLRNSLVAFVLAIIWWSLAAVGLKRAHREGRPYWLVLLPIVVLNVFVALLVPLGRYSVPVLPFLSLLAAFGVDTILRNRKKAATMSPHGVRTVA